MRKVTSREARQVLAALEGLPVAITKDGSIVAVLLSVLQHNQLVAQAKSVVQNQVYRERASGSQDVSHPTEPPLYNPAIHKPGDLVRVQRGKQVLTLTVPELDGDGHPVPL